jgi:hypothetical protein
MTATVDGSSLRTREGGIVHSLSTDVYGLVRSATRYPFIRSDDGKFFVSPDILIIEADNGTTTLAFNVNVLDVETMRCELLQTTLELRRDKCYLGSIRAVLDAIEPHLYTVVDVVYTEDDGVYYTMLQRIYYAYSSLQGEGARDVLPIIARDIELDTENERKREDSIRADVAAWLGRRADRAVSNRRELVATLLSDVQERIAEEAHHSVDYVEVLNEIADAEEQGGDTLALHERKLAILSNFYPTADLVAEETRWLDALRTLDNKNGTINEVVKLVLPDAVRVGIVEPDEREQLKERIELALGGVLLM